MVSLKYQRLVQKTLFFLFVLIFPFGKALPQTASAPAVRQPAKSIRPSPYRNLSQSELQAYQKKMKQEKQQRLLLAKEKRYSNYLKRYKEAQAQAKKAQAARNNKPPIVAKKAPQNKSLTADQERLLQNKEILEGKRPPIAQDDPYFTQFIETKNQLTGRNKRN